MNERTTLEVIAPTVEEAIAQGLSQLGLTADAVSVEVLDSGTKGLFGLGGRQVRVKLTVNPPVTEELPASPAPKPAPAKKAESTPKPAREPRAPREQKPPREAKPRSETKPRPENKPAPEKKQAETSAPSFSSDIHDPLLDKAEEVISRLIHLMGMQAQVSAHFDESASDDRRNILVDVRGEDLSALIGRHAETLNAFQHVASLIVGKETQQWVQVIIDVEGYRSRREKQIRTLANRMAEQVVKTGRKVTMEPMPSSERRVVHMELRGHPAVKTESTGEEPYRKVVILLKE